MFLYLKNMKKWKSMSHNNSVKGDKHVALRFDSSLGDPDF